MRPAISVNPWTPEMTKNNLQWQNIRLVPVLHNRMEFALEVRRQFHEFKPDFGATLVCRRAGDVGRCWRYHDAGSDPGRLDAAYA